MSDTESALRQLMQSSAPSFEPLEGTLICDAASSQTKRRATRAVLPAAAAAAVLLAAIIGRDRLTTRSPADHDPLPTAIATQPIVSPPPTSTSSNTTHPFQVRLVLPATTFPANGQTIHAYVLVTNNTGRPITIRNPCDGWVQVGLIGVHKSFGFSSGDVCPSQTLPEGSTQIPVTLITTYNGCQQGKAPGTPEFPHCIGPDDSTTPNLPPGLYRAEVRTQSTSVRPDLTPPQTVTLTPSR